jgi:hypothetical protein
MSFGVDDVEGAEGHAAAELGVGLVEGERLAEGGETGLKIGNGLGREVVAEIGSEQAAVDVALLQAAVDCEGLLLLGRGRVGGDDGRGEMRDGLGCADGVLIGEDDYGGAIVLRRCRRR